MKLYTEEQMKEAIQIALVPPCNVKDILKEFTPIELPSDEEIEKEANYENFITQYHAFIRSAKWVIDKIKNQQQCNKQ